MSNFSGSNWSSNAEPNNNIMRSYFPDKLQIVKPIEGSQTLHHWQQLATPNLGCLIEPRPGIYIKGKDPNISSSSSSSAASSLEYGHNNIELSVLRKINHLKYSEDLTSDLDETINLSYVEDDDIDNDDAYQFVDTNTTYTLTDTKKALFRMPTIVSSDSLNDTNINLNERLILKKLLNTQKEDYNYNSTTSTTTTITNTVSTILATDTTTTTTSTANNCLNPYLEEIKNLSQKYYTTPLRGDNLKITNKYKMNNLDLSNKLNELNLLNNFQANKKTSPDTPPSSPTNELVERDDSDDEIENINSNEESCKYNNISTPPTSPINIFENENTSSNKNEIKLLGSNFVNEIFDRLSLFSFKSIGSNENSNEKVVISDHKKKSSVVLKPLALYANDDDSTTITTPLTTPTLESAVRQISDELSIKKKKEGIPDTPPPSPTLRASPTYSIPIDDEMLLSFDEKKFQNSAFIKVSTLNPMINKSFDLSKLLGSLTSLKRNQRFV